MSDEPAALHQRLFTIDTHSDTPTASFAKDGWDFAARHARAADHSQIDLPRMRGAVDAMVFAIYVGQMSRSAEGLRVAHELALSHFERTHATLEKHKAECGLALTADDALRLKREGRRAIFLSIENSYSLGRDPANVEKFFKLGVRMLGLTHMLNNDVADSSTDPRGAEWGGLSPLTPVILSHSGCRAVCDHPRNIGDDLLRALAAKGGVIAINALPIAVIAAPGNGRTAAIAEILLRYRDAVPTAAVRAAEERDYDVACAAHPNPSPTLDDFIRHIEHAVAVAGIDHVGIGCDFDGGGGVAGLDEVSDFPALTRALVARGWSEANLAQFWGENTLRLFRAAQT
jgi:membrane dipeptidase